MRIRVAALPGLFIVCLTCAASAAGPAPGTARNAGRPYPSPIVDGQVDSGQFLPDSFVICRVGPRITRVSNFVRSYFDSYIEDRPNADSAGRVTFLENIVAKEVLGQLALEINRPFRFEDRVIMREHEQRTLSNALYRTAVAESLMVTDDELATEYETMKYECRLRHILFADRATAARVRLELQRGTISWKQAHDRYSLAKAQEKTPDGDLGWAVRGGASLDMARKVFLLGPGGISEPIEEAQGWNLVQVAERRPGTPPSLSAVGDFLRSQLAEERVVQRTRSVRDVVRAQTGMVYDSTNIAWAAKQFLPTQTTSPDENGVTEVRFNTVMPEFQDADTARVLGRYRDGDFTLGHFMHMLTDIQPLFRPSVDTPAALRDQLDAFAFEPYMAKVAIERGLGRDSTVMAQLAGKREQLLVEHLYSDSVLSRVSIDPKARRKYYQAHLRGFVTWSSVRFAALWTESRPAAEALAARLKSGEDPEDIIRADSLLGVQRGSIQTRAENEHGAYQKVLFEELKPGQLTIDGPDKLGHFSVVKKLETIPGRQLSYDEASGYIDDSMQNVESERLLKQLVARHRKKYPVVSHPELVMRIKLVDPSL